MAATEAPLKPAIASLLGTAIDSGLAKRDILIESLKPPPLPLPSPSNVCPSLHRRLSWCLKFFLQALAIMVAIPSVLLASRAFSPILDPISIIDGLDSLNFNGKNSNNNNVVKTNVFASINGPVITSNFPDPAVIHEGSTTYAFATRDRNKPPQGRAHVQVAASSNNKTWTLLDKDAMPSLGNWETGNAVWAPDVVKLADDKFVMYYCDVPKTAKLKHCIGAATASNVEGPYQPLDDVFICPDPKTQGGAIDPEGFFDHSTGKRYVIYKVDGNSIGHGGLCNNAVPPLMPTPIMLQEVDAKDGITKIGEPIQMIDRDSRNGPLIEAPAMHRSSEGIYFLFYSSNCYTTPGYDVEYATATDIRGPWEKQDTRLLHSGDGPGLIGPGGFDIIADGEFAVFHGILAMQNSKAFKATVEAEAKKQKKSAQNLAKTWPLVRGMYTAKATFKGRVVTLG